MARKIFFSLALTLVFSMSLAWAAETPTPATAQQTLSLEKCLELAYTNNQQLKSATQSVVVAQANVKKAEGGFLPTLDYQVAYSKSDEKIASVSYQDDQMFTGGLSASYPLYTGGKLQNTLKIAQLQLDIAREKERNAKQNLTYNVKSAYNQLWLVEEQLLVANTSYENMARHAERIEKLYAVGNTSKFELLRAQVNRDNQKPAVIKSQNGVELAKLNLATLIGLSKDTQFDIAFIPDHVKLPENPTTNSNTALTAAYANRSELKQLQLSTQLTDVQVNMAEAYRKPDVALTGSYEGAGTELSPGSWNKAVTLTLGVKGNFFDGTNKPQVSAAKGELELQKIQEQSLKDSIRQEVEQVLQTIKENVETAKSTQASIGLAKESLRLTEVRFQAGMATTMDVMDAQLALDQASTGYYSSLAAYLTALDQLALVTGQN
jgi:outer membrane protein